MDKSTHPTPEQMEVAFGEIADLAHAVRSLCDRSHEDVQNAVAAAELAVKIGYLADMCIGFEHFGSDHYLLPTGWKTKSEVHHG